MLTPSSSTQGESEFEPYGNPYRFNSSGFCSKSWLTTANAGTGGRSPLDAAASGESGYNDAIRAPADKVLENEKLQQARERKEKAVVKLSAAAHSRYVDPVRANLWMRGKRHELGGKSPEEFVIDDITLQRCMELLPPKRSKY